MNDEIINGNEINCLLTINSMWADNCIRVVMNDMKEYRMRLDDVLTLLRGKNLKIVNKRKWGYFIPEKGTDGMPEKALEPVKVGQG